MSEHHVPTAVPAQQLLIQHLPPVFRIQSIARLPFYGRHALNRAVLFHERASMTVEWVSRQVDVGLVVGALVAIRWDGRSVCVNGAVRIARIVLLERPESAVNLFETVPKVWVSDRELIRRAAFLWECLPSGLRHLFNAVFWRGRRFHRYLTGAKSIAGHHAGRYGDLRHSIEVADRALDLATRVHRVHVGVLIMAALLRDAGKADEYMQGARRLRLSDRRKPIDHRLTALDWVAAARERYRVILPEAHYLALANALTSVKWPPAWLSLREPQSLEAILLSAADRISGQSNLMARHAPLEEGFGRYHPNLGVRPYMLIPGV